MRTRYSSFFLLLASLAFADFANAQNRQVTGTTDADGIYTVQPGTINGKTFYRITGQQRTIYGCQASTLYNNGTFSCGADAWIVASQPYAGASTSSTTILYVIQSSAATAPTGTYNRFNGASANAAVTDTALPVELTSFEPVVSGRNVQLIWTTASETNNAGFSVEMKTNGTFAERGFVAGHGTTAEAQRYAFDAGTLAPGRYTFRLRQVDFDGAFEYSPEVEVAIELAEAAFLSAPQPNPMGSRAQVKFASQRTQHATVTMYDMLGRSVRELFNGTLSAGEVQSVRIERGNLPAGLYLIQFRAGERQTTQQITLL